MVEKQANENQEPEKSDSNLITKRIEEKSTSLTKEEPPTYFDAEKAGFEMSGERLKIAKLVLYGLFFLALVCMGLLACLDLDNKREILFSTIIAIFSTATLVIGFVAGSSIDRK